MKYAIPTVFVLLTACAGAPIPAAATLPSDADAGASFPDDDGAGVTLGDTCARAYRVLRSCHCPEAEPTMGAAFPEWCRSMGFAIDAACISTARTCGALHVCHVRCAAR